MSCCGKPIDGDSIDQRIADLENNSHQTEVDFDTGTASITTTKLFTPVISSTDDNTSIAVQTTNVSILPGGAELYTFSSTFSRIRTHMSFEAGYSAPDNLMAFFKSTHSQTWNFGVVQDCLYESPAFQFNEYTAGLAPTYSGGVFTIHQDGRYLISCQNIYNTSGLASINDEYNIWFSINGSNEKFNWTRMTIAGSIGNKLLVNNSSFLYDFTGADTVVIKRIQTDNANGFFGYLSANDFGYVSFLKIS